MYGRSCTCLLVISILTLAPVMLNGQSDRPAPARDFVRRFPSRADRPPEVDPFRPPVPITPPTRQPETISFPVIARAAHIIFSGTVTSIACRPATHSQAVETVAITFHVENAIRGTTPGEYLTILQWIGLWSGGQRYRVGERVLLFLYPPSKLGLTSSVGGGMGRFTIDPRGRVLLSEEHLSAFRQNAVLGGRSQVRFRDFSLAVKRVNEEE